MDRVARRKEREERWKVAETARAVLSVLCTCLLAQLRVGLGAEWMWLACRHLPTDTLHAIHIYLGIYI
eukprot:1395432-Lingulodinium_polyedra.AAC.1